MAAYDRAAGELQLAAATAPGDLQVRDARLRTARQTLLNDSPDVADLVMVEPPDMAQLERSLTANQAVLMFFQGERQWYVFTLTLHRRSVLSFAADDLERPALALRQALRGGAGQDWRGPATTFYRAVLAPSLRGVDASSLIIVPAGVLNYVPFAAAGENGQFLIDHYAIRMVPNLQLLARPAARQASGRPLVIGDPLHGDPVYGLPFAAAEAQTVAKMLPGSTLLMGRQATVARVIELAADHDLIHFAGHGLYDPVQPLQSALLLASPDGKVDMLTAARLYDMRTPATLAFLSACDTGIGKVAGGQDVLGMQRGFFFAGVQAVIGSLWPVQDNATGTRAGILPSLDPRGDRVPGPPVRANCGACALSASFPVGRLLRGERGGRVTGIGKSPARRV